MNPQQMMKQVVDFNKATFERSFSVMTTMQDQTEKMFSTWLDRNPLLPEPGKKAVAEWVGVCKKNRDEFKAKIDEGYASFCEYLDGLEK